LSADGAPVVIHDETVDRTTDGRGAVSRLTLQVLRRLDAGAWFAPAFRGQRIPTLEETLDWASRRCGLNLELKPGGRPPAPKVGVTPATRDAGGGRPEDRPLAEAVARALAESRFHGPLIVSSFSVPSLLQARAILPKMRIGLLVSRTGRGLREVHRRIGLYALHPHQRLATPRTISAAHRLGLRVFVWPVNDPRQIARLTARGADGLMTDDPALFDALAPTPRSSRPRSLPG
jgi:glycerophosphoryl diester phosphodiesterase